MLRQPARSAPRSGELTDPRGCGAASTATADLRVEAVIPAGEALRIASALDRASTHLERVFGRTFSERPRVPLFATLPIFR